MGIKNGSLQGVQRSQSRKNCFSCYKLPPETTFLQDFFSKTALIPTEKLLHMRSQSRHRTLLGGAGVLPNEPLAAL